ncbi:MAG: hypothetical protein KKB51_00050 [Candidatus Riflebacteria bacterium]|nr:hypothetical protein [Candidatus Riflebacteria bacterium]
MIVGLLLLLSNDVEAADVYALFNYRDKSEVHLIVSLQSPANPFGQLFFAHSATAFHIDGLNRFKLTYFDETGDYMPMRRRIFRQIFDGLPSHADWGKGHAQHQDQRDLLIPDQSGRSVFRSRGAPFSSGPGFLASEQSALQKLASGEVEILPDKNWYEISNDSWYQTWFTNNGEYGLSYIIAYDRWEEKINTVRDSIWGGFPPTKFDEQTIGKYVDYRLRRASVDGAMELLTDSREFAVVLNQSARTAVFQYDDLLSGCCKTAIYSWSGSAPGVLYSENQILDPQVTFESQHQQKRFPAIFSGNHLIVMGTDLLHRWLQIHGLQHADAECTMTQMVPGRDSQSAFLYVYSAPNNSLYRFYNDNGTNMDWEEPQVTRLAFTPSAMTADHEGNLILGSFSVWPQSFTDDEDILMSVEAINLMPKPKAAKMVKGTMLLTQQHYYNIYRASPESIDPVWSGRLNVGRHFYQCEFAVEDQPKGPPSDVRALIKLARQSGNSLSTPTRQSERHQPGQFVIPEQVFLAVSK